MRKSLCFVLTAKIKLGKWSICFQRFAQLCCSHTSSTTDWLFWNKSQSVKTMFMMWSTLLSELSRLSWTMVVFISIASHTAFVPCSPILLTVTSKLPKSSFMGRIGNDANNQDWVSSMICWFWVLRSTFLHRLDWSHCLLFLKRTNINVLMIRNLLQKTWNLLYKYSSVSVELVFSTSLIATAPLSPIAFTVDCYDGLQNTVLPCSSKVDKLFISSFTSVVFVFKDIPNAIAPASPILLSIE